MNILVTNDDGILSPGLWTLVKELNGIAGITVVAPDREQSATGTAVTLRQPLRLQKITPFIPEIAAYSVEGSPCDSVILALSKIIDERPDLVVSGINFGLNTGDDVLISGTVGAALQGYLRGIPAIAISVLSYDNGNSENAARLVRELAKKFKDKSLQGDMFLNVNIPDISLANINGIKVTRQAHKTHIETVKEGYDGKREYYWLTRQRLDNNAEPNTDIYALNNGNISITPLNETLFNKPSPDLNDNLCSKLFDELRKN